MCVGDMKGWLEWLEEGGKTRFEIAKKVLYLERMMIGSWQG